MACFLNAGMLKGAVLSTFESLIATSIPKLAAAIEVLPHVFSPF
jgi:hypothetical protein